MNISIKNQILAGLIEAGIEITSNIFDAVKSIDDAFDNLNSHISGHAPIPSHTIKVIPGEWTEENEAE